MKLPILSLFLLGLVAAAPAPVAAPAAYDRRLPSRRGRIALICIVNHRYTNKAGGPPVNVVRRDVEIDVVKVTATGTGTAAMPLKTAWPTSVGTGTAPALKSTGTGAKAAIFPTGTSPVVLVTGTAGTIISAAPTPAAIKNAYKFPVPSMAKVGKRAAGPAKPFWWLQN